MLTIDFSTDGRMILSGCTDKTIKLWDVDTLKFKSSYVGHTNWVNSVKMSPDINLICSGGEDKKLLIWDQNKKKNIQKYDMFDQPITKAVFHPI